MAQGAPLVCGAHPALRALWVHKVTMEILDHQDHLASWEREACQAFLGKKEKLEEMEKLELRALLGHLVSVGCLACLEFLDQRAIVDFQAWMEQKERWVAQV